MVPIRKHARCTKEQDERIQYLASLGMTRSNIALELGEPLSAVSSRLRGLREAALCPGIIHAAHAKSPRWSAFELRTMRSAVEERKAGKEFLQLFTNRAVETILSKCRKLSLRLAYHQISNTLKYNMTKKR
jgi:hypothetical protein